MGWLQGGVCPRNISPDDGSVLELIAISRTTKPQIEQPRSEKEFGEREMRHRGSVPFDGEEDVYNVLAIEWKDGIAYRADIGRVSRAAWELNGYDEIDVKLG